MKILFKHLVIENSLSTLILEEEDYQNIKNIALKLRGERIEDLFIPEGFEVPEELNASISVNGQIFANIYTYKVK